MSLIGSKARKSALQKWLPRMHLMRGLGLYREIAGTAYLAMTSPPVTRVAAVNVAPMGQAGYPA